MTGARANQKAVPGGPGQSQARTGHGNAIKTISTPEELRDYMWRRAQERDRRALRQHVSNSEKHEGVNHRKSDGSRRMGKEPGLATTKTHKVPKTTTKRGYRPYTLRYITAVNEDKTKVPASEEKAASEAKAVEPVQEEPTDKEDKTKEPAYEKPADTPVYIKPSQSRGPSASEVRRVLSRPFHMGGGIFPPIGGDRMGGGNISRWGGIARMRFATYFEMVS